MDLPFFVTVPRGLESLLAGELHGLDTKHVKQARAGVSLSCSQETAYRICLWSRLATRVLLPLTSGPAGDTDELYATVQRVYWDNHVRVDGTLAVYTQTREDPPKTGHLALVVYQSKVAFHSVKVHRLAAAK